MFLLFSVQKRLKAEEEVNKLQLIVQRKEAELEKLLLAVTSEKERYFNLQGDTDNQAKELEAETKRVAETCSIRHISGRGKPMKVTLSLTLILTLCQSLTLNLKLTLTPYPPPPLTGDICPTFSHIAGNRCIGKDNSGAAVVECCLFLGRGSV